MFFIELIDILTQFAKSHGILFNYGFNEEKGWYFYNFQNRERTWTYQRSFTEDELKSISVSATTLAENVIKHLYNEMGSSIHVDIPGGV